MWTCMECGLPIKDGEHYFEMKRKRNWNSTPFHESVKVEYMHLQCLLNLKGKVKNLSSQLETARKVAEANCDI